MAVPVKAIAKGIDFIWDAIALLRGDISAINGIIVDGFITIKANFSSQISTIVEKVTGFITSYESGIGRVLKWFKALSGDLGALGSIVLDGFISIKANFSDEIDALAIKLANFITDYHNGIGRVLDWFKALSGDLGALSSSVVNGFITLASDFGGFIRDVVQGIKDLANGNHVNFTKIFSSLTDGFKNMVDNIIGLPASIVKAFKSMLLGLFVPDEGFMDAQVTRLKNKYVFVASVETTVLSLYNALKNASSGTPPKITVNLSASTSSRLFKNIGKSAYVLNMAWFKPYKPVTDGILSGIMLIVFVWNVYNHLPNIINGIGSFSVATAKINGYRGEEE